MVDLAKLEQFGKGVAMLAEQLGVTDAGKVGAVVLDGDDVLVLAPNSDEWVSLKKAFGDGDPEALGAFLSRMFPAMSTGERLAITSAVAMLGSR